MSSRVRRLVIVLAFAIGIGGTAAALRGPLLRQVGALLVSDEAQATTPSVDVIVVAIDAGSAGLLEAADLVRSGVSERVAVFTDWPTPAERELARRGAWVEDWQTRSARQLHDLGVSAVEVIPQAVDGSEDAARVFPSWLAQRGFRSAVLVTTVDHSRRVERLFSRSIKGHTANVLVRSARYSSFNPDDWWSTRNGLRTGVTELQKLLIDVVRHPLS